jgi:hypothetical protein
MAMVRKQDVAAMDVFDEQELEALHNAIHLLFHGTIEGSLSILHSIETGIVRKSYHAYKSDALSLLDSCIKMCWAKKIRSALTEGNTSFMREEYRSAILCYQKTEGFILHCIKVRSGAVPKEIQVQCLHNHALCHLKLNNSSLSLSMLYEARKCCSTKQHSRELSQVKESIAFVLIVQVVHH